LGAGIATVLPWNATSELDPGCAHSTLLLRGTQRIHHQPHQPNTGRINAEFTHKAAVATAVLSPTDGESDYGQRS